MPARLATGDHVELLEADVARERRDGEVNQLTPDARIKDELAQSMYTGLAQPEVKTNGLSSKNSTAFTSSSILAVVSAMNAPVGEVHERREF